MGLPQLLPTEAGNERTRGIPYGANNFPEALFFSPDPPQTNDSVLKNNTTDFTLSHYHIQTEGIVWAQLC